MARAKAVCTCKKCGKVFVKYADKHSREEANSWEAWAVENFTICPDCAEEVAQEKAASNGLAELSGTPKQIAWANKIRDQFASDCQKDLKEIDPAGLEMFKDFLNKIFTTKTNAGWWIDHRNNSHVNMLNRMISEEMN